MENKQVETSGSRKARVSKGKLKKSSNRKGKRQSQGFSSSFTQKTLHNNTLLAQSLAKEKSRNEKFLVLHRELMTSRNEALMRLNETEASFDRLGVLVQKGIRQMQEVASTMGEVYSEIRASKNNPRDSASMRSSWDETVSSASHTIMKQPLPHMNGVQENAAVNAQSPQWPLHTPSLPVSPIEEEELEMTCSDDDTLREDSLVCRRAPTPQQPTHGSFGDGASALDGEAAVQPTRPVRKVPRGLTKLPGHDFGSTSSSWLEDDDAHNRTSLSLVDMDETVVHGVPTAQTSDAALMFNTVTGERVDEESPEDLSYEEVFCVPPKHVETHTVAKMNALLAPASNMDHARRSVISPQLPGTDREPLDGGSPARTDSPDFLGFSNENINWPIQVTADDCASESSNEEGSIVPHLYDFSAFTAVKSTSSKKHNGTSYTTKSSKSPRLRRLVAISSGNNAVSPKKIHSKSPNIEQDDAVSQKKIHHKATNIAQDNAVSRNKIHRKSPIIVQKQSTLSSTGHPNSKSSSIKSSLTSLSPGGNVFNSDPLKKAVHDSKQSKPKLTKSPSVSKSTNIQQAFGLEQSDASEHRSVLPKSSEASLKRSTCTPTMTRNSDVASKPDDSPMITSLETPSAPDVRIARSVEVSTTHAPGRARSSTKSPPRDKSGKLPGDDAATGSRSLTRPASETGNGGQRGRANLPTPGSQGPTASEPASRSRTVSGPRRNTDDADRSRGRPKRALTMGDGSDTPSRGPEAKTRKLVVLVNRLEDSLGYRDSSASEQDATERRTRRRIAQANYKEPSLNTKIRRPDSKDHV